MKASSDTRVEMIALDEIVPNRYQPRRVFKEEGLRELAQSIEENGIIQPIIVRRSQEAYELVAGERRYRAVKLLGLEKIPALVMDIEDSGAAKLAVIENIQREDLNVVEEALGYRNIIEDFKITQVELGERIGKSRSYISNTIRLLDLVGENLEYLASGSLSSGHGKLLLSVKEPGLQRQLGEKIVAEGLTVKEAEALIKSGRKSPRPEASPSYLRELEEDLMDRLGTKVKLVSRKNRGVIEIEFYGEEDLARILDILS